MKSRIISMAAGAVVLVAAVATAQQPTTQQQTAQPAAGKQPAQQQAVQAPGAQHQTAEQKGATRGQGRGPKAVAKYLELTPDQQEGWEKIQTETAAVVRPLKDKMLVLQNQLTDQTQAAKPDSAEIAKLTQGIRDLQTQVRALRDQSNVKLAALLTPAQKTKFEEFEAAGRARRAAHEQQKQQH